MYLKMESLKKTRNDDFGSPLSSLIGGTNKRKYKHISCGDSNSLIREGNEIIIAPGQQEISYNIEDTPFLLQFACTEDKDACYKHDESDAIICLSKDKQDVKTGNMYKIAKDKRVDIKETNNLNLCFHQEMQDFANGSASVFHKDLKTCTELYEKAFKTCSISGSKKCKSQIKKISSIEKTCKLTTDNIDERMAGFPYTADSDYNELKRTTPSKQFDLMLDDRSFWAKTVEHNGKRIGPSQCKVLGEPCGLNNDVYYGQCVIVRENTAPICKPILDEFTQKDANNWVDDHPEIKKNMENEAKCGSTHKNFGICREFNEYHQCLHTIQEYTTNESGEKCSNPYYAKKDNYNCQYN
jgi:hypothetical protein